MSYCFVHIDFFQASDKFVLRVFGANPGTETLPPGVRYVVAARVSQNPDGKVVRVTMTMYSHLLGFPGENNSHFNQILCTPTELARFLVTLLLVP